MRVEMGSEIDIAEGRPKCVTVSQRSFALFKVAGRVYCLDNRCTHMGGPLCQGSLKESVVTCPWHGSRFDVRTGEVVGPPARSSVRSYAVTVEAGELFVELP